MTLDEELLALTAPERARVDRVMHRLSQRSFKPFPAKDLDRRRRAMEEAWASGALEGLEPDRLDRVLSLTMLVRRVPDDLAVELLLADVVEHAGVAPGREG